MLFQADATHIPFLDQTFHCCVTSPPYWGLRRYLGEQQRVWGGDADCEHEFVERKYYTMRGASSQSSEAFSKAGQSNADRLKSARWMTDSICQKCGAWYGALGLEPIPELYIQHIVEIFREVWRVLRPDGTVWLNMGDSYSGSGGPGSQYDNKSTIGFREHFEKYENPNKKVGNLAGGNLMMMPHRIALALQAAGWIVRQDCLWKKVNPMPESVHGWSWTRHRIKIGRRPDPTPETYGSEFGHGLSRQAGYREEGGLTAEWVDCPGCEKCLHDNPLFPPLHVLKRGSWRHTRAHEYIFQLVKGPKMSYYTNQEVVRESGTSSPSDVRKMIEQLPRIGGKTLTADDPLYKANQETNIGKKRGVGSPMRNPRSVLDVPTTPYSGAHYATFPPKLIAPLIRASCPKRCCPECGAPWAPVVEKGELQPHPDVWSSKSPHQFNAETNVYDESRTLKSVRNINVIDYRPTCSCECGDHIPGICLDPFIGSGTTGAVARELGRRWVGLDISMEYLDQQAKVRALKWTPSNALDNLPLFSIDSLKEQS